MTPVVPVTVPSDPAVMVIGCPAMDAPRLLTSRKSISLFALPGAATACSAVAVSFAPVTANGAEAVSVPLVALTVMARLDGSAPMETVATL